VSVIRAHPTPRGAGHLFRAVVAAWVLVLALVVPAGAVEGPTKLFDPSLSAKTGTPTTTITFTVEYRNREGSAPAYVRVVIDGTAHKMTGDGGDDWKQGVTHRFSTKLAVGTHDVSFIAADTRKFSDEVAGGTVTISVPPTPTPDPTPKPTPKPDPTPKPTPDPTPPPAPTSTPAGGSTGGSGGTGATGGSGVPGGSAVPGSSDPGAGSGGTDGTGTGTGTGTGSGTGGTGTGSGGDGTPANDTQTWGGGAGLDSAAARGSSTDSSDVSDSRSEDSRTFMAGAIVAGAAGGTGGTPGTGGGGGSESGGSTGSGGSGGSSGLGGTWGTLAAALDVLGIQNGPTTSPMLPTLVGTTGAVAMAMSFAIFGKKRRDEEQPAPDEVLQANAARGIDIVPTSDMARGVVAAAAVPTPVDLEASMPRWRRPSLQQARKADPSRSFTAAPRLRFDDESGAGIGYERRVIRYRVVRLLDAPDELRSVEIGQLDQGDEVQLLEKSGAYWLVVVPDGRRGWIHKMTLGDVVADESASAADAWNVGDIDGDVLSAFLAARARA
jgi:hypothetical protein